MADLVVASRAILEQVPCGIFLLSADSRVRHANRLARDWSRESDPLCIRRGILYVEGMPACERLKAAPMLTDAAAIMRTGARGNGADRSGGSRRLRLMMTTLGLRRADDPVALYVYDDQLCRHVSVDVLRKLYGLTLVEARVAERLFAGDSVGEVATRLRVSVNTVRSHLKRVFNKCDVGSQVDLVRLLSTGPCTRVADDAARPRSGDSP